MKLRNLLTVALAILLFAWLNMVDAKQLGGTQLWANGWTEIT